MIVKIFKDLKTEKIIDNRITIHFKAMSKDKVVVEVKELTYNLLGKLSKISFKISILLHYIDIAVYLRIS